MKTESTYSPISAETLAAYLDGNATAQETQQVLDTLADDTELQELMHISQLIDEELGLEPHAHELLPMTALAASCTDSCLCSIKCEAHILSKRGIPFDEQQLLSSARQNGWLKQQGAALHNVGRSLEACGLAVRRQYKCTISDITEALDCGDDLIAAVDAGELQTHSMHETFEDLICGPQPDHTVVILSCNTQQQTITIHDPNSPNTQDTYPIGQFLGAWNDSKNYLITINTKDMKPYIPTPIDLSDVALPEDLNELREAIAENAHDIWAKNRQAEGWTYGPQRDDKLKQTPDMVPYADLPEKEKDYDRNMAIDTLKLMHKLGYDIIKREDTPRYDTLLERLRNTDEQFYCPACQKEGRKTPIFINDVFCTHCGKTLDIDWNIYKKKKKK